MKFSSNVLITGLHFSPVQGKRTENSSMNQEGPLLTQDGGSLSNKVMLFVGLLITKTT